MTCFLGITMDSGLSWSNHIDNLCLKLNKSLFSLRYLSEFLNMNTLKIVYYGYFVSLLNYGIIFWGAASMSSVCRVFKLQKKAIRLIYGVRSRESCREVFLRERLMTLPSLFIYSVSVYTYRNPHLFSTGTHHYTTRNKNNLLIPIHHSNKFRKSIEYLGPTILNNLPNTIKICNSLNIFQKHLKTFLISKVFYSVDEFFSSA